MDHDIRWTIPKIERRLALIEPLVYRRRQNIAPFRYQVQPDPAIPTSIGPDFDDSLWETIQPGTYWSEPDTNFVLRSRLEVPANWPPDAPLALHLPLGDTGSFSHPEALIYIDGVALAACDRHHQEILLPARYRPGQTQVLALHGWTGQVRGADRQQDLKMGQGEVVQIDPLTRDFIATARVALEVAQTLDSGGGARDRLLTVLDEAFKLLDTREPFGEEFYASVPAAQAALREGIAAAGQSLDVGLVAAGHAHLDVAWLWTLAQTRRKAGRTFHTVLHLMDQFPDYHFSQSQPQLYEFVRKDYPDLFARIKERVAEGRWELIGGMWIEADCNLSGPEALARQFLLGRAFFKEHFGPASDAPVLWLPDVFGYSWAMPQLIKQAGLEYFFSVKISWSQYNRFPYDSFWWQGLDGTQVLTHFSSTPESGISNRSTYNAQADPEAVVGTWRRFRHKAVQTELLMAFGYGDGGGGPSREMLENIHELKDFPATPRVRPDTVANFFHAMDAQAGDRLPTWNGELYLEYHRGTYTTHGRNKRANRQTEFLLHDAELLATIATVLNRHYRYPSGRLQEAWELVCLNQFHDIIPGSSIGAVYRESLAQYEQVKVIADQVLAGALAALQPHFAGDLLVFNPTAFACPDLIAWMGHLQAGQTLQLPAGATVLTQPTPTGTLISCGTLSPLSLQALDIVKGSAPTPETGLIAATHLLENRFVRVELNDDGDVSRIYDKVHQREVLVEGQVANQFQAFEDRPLNWDAWDVDIFYDDKMWTSDRARSITVVSHGPLRATLAVKRRILNSEYIQHISLDYNSPLLRFETDIDWQERHILLKVAFPVDILSPYATYDIQWGNVQRPTHRNTSWDWARFETCAQKWVDLSEGGYGVSLLNDGKYGHDVRDNVIRLSLLRGPTQPDPEADLGRHRFSYALLPHAGDWSTQTIAAAYRFNDAARVFQSSGPGQAVATVFELFSVDREHVVIETVKRAEDGRGIIVRLYESQRKRSKFSLKANFDVQSAALTNLLEEDDTELEVKDNSVEYSIKPYQIHTIRVIPANMR